MILMMKTAKTRRYCRQFEFLKIYYSYLISSHGLIMKRLITVNK